MNIMGSTAHGLFVGAGIGVLGNKTSSLNRQLDARNYPKIFNLPAKAAIGTGGLSAEAGFFTGTGLVTGGIPEDYKGTPTQYAAEQFVRNLAFVSVLKSSHLPMKLFKGPNPEKFTKNLGNHEFKLTEGERIEIFKKERPNATETEIIEAINTKGFNKNAFELIEGKINDFIKAKDMKGLADYVKDLPTDIYAKFNWSAANIETRVTDMAESALTGAKMTSTTDAMGNQVHLVKTYGYNGSHHSTESFKTAKEAQNRDDS